MKRKVGKYPDKDDYKPYADKKAPEETIELPLSDPSESNVTEAFTYAESHTDGEMKPSAFSVNMDLQQRS